MKHMPGDLNAVVSHECGVNTEGEAEASSFHLETKEEKPTFFLTGP